MENGQLKHSTVVFLSGSHEYRTTEGKALSGMTALLNRHIFPDKYADVPPSVLRRAAERGSYIVTVVKGDTVVVEKAIPQIVFVNRVVKDTLFTTDTVKVEVFVPINKYIFSDSLYRAEISSYNVSLDRIEI